MSKKHVFFQASLVTCLDAVGTGSQVKETFFRRSKPRSGTSPTSGPWASSCTSGCTTECLRSRTSLADDWPRSPPSLIRIIRCSLIRCRILSSWTPSGSVWRRIRWTGLRPRNFCCIRFSGRRFRQRITNLSDKSGRRKNYFFANSFATQ